jgi:hypothetical protein
MKSLNHHCTNKQYQSEDWLIIPVTHTINANRWKARCRYPHSRFFVSKQNSSTVTIQFSGVFRTNSKLQKCTIIGLLSFLKENKQAYKIAILSVCLSPLRDRHPVCVSVPLQISKMGHLILTKLAVHLVSLTNIKMEPIQFLNFENCLE